MQSTKDAIQLCITIRALAQDASTSKADCRTLARFVGKIMLILQAIAELPCDKLVQNWAELIGDVREALGGAAELVEGCASMGRLQALLQSEESGARFSAVATDLALAVGALCALRDHVPADVHEDLPLLKRQLDRLRFASCAAQERLTWQLLQALALQYVQAGGGARGVAAPALKVKTLLQEAVHAAGLDPGNTSWVDAEVATLLGAVKAAAREEDEVAEFFYRQVIIWILAHLTGACWSDGGEISLPQLSGALPTNPLSSASGQQHPPSQDGAAGEEGEGSGKLPTSSLDSPELRGGGLAAPLGSAATQSGPVGVSPGSGWGDAAANEHPAEKQRQQQQQRGEQTNGVAAGAEAPLQRRHAEGECDGPTVPASAVHHLLTCWFRGGEPPTPGGNTPGGVPTHHAAAGATPADPHSGDPPIHQGTGMQEAGITPADPELPASLAPDAALGSCPEAALPLSPATLRGLQEAFSAQECGHTSAVLRRIDPGNLGSVVTALSSPALLTQFVAAVVVEAHAEEGREEGRAALVVANVIPSLLRALHSSRHPILRGTIATAFRHLARDAATRRRIAEAGAIPLLAQLLTSGSRGTRQAAARALSNLVVNSEANKVEVTKFGAVHSFLRMLESECEYSREASAAALANLAANSDETQAVIAAAGAIPPLVATLRSGTAAGQQHAARALRNLAGRDNRNKLRTAEAGAIPLLLSMMRSSCEATCQAGASALSNIAANCEETQLQIAEAGGLPTVLSVLEGGPGSCQEAAAWLLSNLACCSQVRVHVPCDRVAPPLVALLGSGTESGKQAAARALKSLSAGPSNTAKLIIAEAGAIPPLVSCLRSPCDPTRKAAAAALWNLAYRNNANRRAIAKAGAIPPLVAMLRPSGSEGCRQEAARALSNLSCNNEHNQGIEMAREGAIPLLVSMMTNSQAPAGAREAATGAISNLACIKANQEEILESGALPALLSLLAPSQPIGCQEAAARAFSNLVCDSMSAPLRAQAAEAVPSLVRLLSTGNEGARQAAARALSNLACSDPESQLRVAESGAAAALVALAQYPNEDLREAAALALWDICYDCPRGREAVVAAGGVPWLTELLLFGGDGAKEAAAASIAELAAVGPAVRREIEEAGALPLLRQLATGDCQETALAATEALRALEAHNAAEVAGG